MIVPWPAIRRGTEATVPRPPGLVSVMFAPDEVVGSEPVVARLLDDLVVGLDEAVEGQPPGAADDGHHQRPRTVRLLDVDGDPQVRAARRATRWGLPSSSA